MPRGSRLTLVETAEAASQLRASDNPVALSPWAAAELDRRSISYLCLDDFYSTQDREELGVRNVAAVEQFGAAVDDLAARIAPDLGRSGFRPGSAAFFYIKRQRDSVTLRLLELERLIALTGATVIHYVGYRPPHGVPGRLDFMGESLYAQLLPLAARRAGIKLVRIGEHRWPFVTSVANPWPLAKVTRRTLELGQALLQRGRLLRRDRGSVVCLDARLIPVVVSRTPYAPLLWRDGGPTAFLIGRLPRLVSMRMTPRSTAVPERLRRDLESWYGNGDPAWRELGHFLNVDGLDLRPVLESRLRHLVMQLVPGLAQIFSIAQRRLPQLETRLVLGRAYSEPPDRIIAQAARSAGIPVVGYDHGATGYFYYPMDGHTMSSVPDFRLVWGDGVRRTAERRYPAGPTIVTVGSIMLESLGGRKPTERAKSRRLIASRLGLDPRRPTVLYAVTSMSTNINYISHRICSDVEYYERQRRIVDTLRGFPEVQAIVKLHPTGSQPQSPIVGYLAASRSRNCVCVSAIPLDQMLDVADLFINDSPTTTLLQMLTTGRPVIALDNGGLVLEPEAETLLRKAVTYCDTIEELDGALKDRLTRRDFANEDHAAAAAAFLAEYGTAGGDGRSAERIGALIARIAGGDGSVHKDLIGR